MVSYLWPLAVGGCQRPYSIRTRIKTARGAGQWHDSVRVRDHIPLEQGLRLTCCYLFFHGQVVRDHIPLEQGLRLEVARANLDPIKVRDHIPLEQGLRLFHLFSVVFLTVSETIFH